jgi:hypothetical protein
MLSNTSLEPTAAIGLKFSRSAVIQTGSCWAFSLRIGSLLFLEIRWHPKSSPDPVIPTAGLDSPRSNRPPVLQLTSNTHTP